MIEVCCRGRTAAPTDRIPVTGHGGGADEEPM
ncbi:hypothetical protein C8D89_102355 [Actinomycetospora cinnamomea]|uniref:Uncharacterized protein n=1 Tax=Actinomycetospora cinnamomea TaxID=663609 RepID=A0A2U1FLZ7_9PSEU|nr:hypothetical protein C8D89_102355 [Actinomycetospora cinnamomea]